MQILEISTVAIRAYAPEVIVGCLVAGIALIIAFTCKNRIVSMYNEIRGISEDERARSTSWDGGHTGVDPDGVPFFDRDEDERAFGAGLAGEKQAR